MISIDYSLIIVIFNFILLLIILNKLLFKPMKKFLEDRQNEVKKEMDDAHKNRQESEELLMKRKDELKASAEEIRNLTKEARKEADIQAENIIQDAKKRQKAIARETDEMVELKKKEALLDVESQVVSMVSDLTGRIIDKKIDPKDDQKLIDSVIKEDK